MKNRTHITLASVGILALSAIRCSATASAPASANLPNIVFIITDDLGFGDLGCYGGTGVDTPVIDKLAADGLRFTQAYAPSSTCTPSRYALLTGEYPWRQSPKKTSILDGDAPLAIDPARPTLATFLQAQGYSTGLVGKWHLGLGDGITPVDFNREIKPGPLEIGFDSAFFIPATVDRVPTVFIDGHRVHNLDPADPIQVSYISRIGEEPVGHEHPELLKVGADRQHADTITNGISRIGHMSGGTSARWIDEDIADTIAGRSAAFIAEQGDKPFFLYVGTHDPHVPRMPHPRFRGKSRSGIRGDTIAQIDWTVGAVLDALEKAGIADNTIVIFTSDNGPVLFDGYYDNAVEDLGSHKPAGNLRGWKYLRYEGGTRVPLIVRWPGHVPAGKTDDVNMFCLVDMLATTAGLLDKAPPPNAGIDGMNLSALFFGKTPALPRTNVVEHGIGNVLALRSGDWKYIPSNTDTSTGIGRGADPRDTRFADANVPEPLLFNLAKDPGERKNLASKRPKRLAKMIAELEQIRSATAAN